MAQAYEECIPKNEAAVVWSSLRRIMVDADSHRRIPGIRNPETKSGIICELAALTTDDFTKVISLYIAECDKAIHSLYAPKAVSTAKKSIQIFLTKHQHAAWAGGVHHPESAIVCDDSIQWLKIEAMEKIILPLYHQDIEDEADNPLRLYLKEDLTDPSMLWYVCRNVGTGIAIAVHLTKYVTGLWQHISQSDYDIYIIQTMPGISIRIDEETGVSVEDTFPRCLVTAGEITNTGALRWLASRINEINPDFVYSPKLSGIYSQKMLQSHESNR